MVVKRLSYHCRFRAWEDFQATLQLSGSEDVRYDMAWIVYVLSTLKRSGTPAATSTG